MLNHQRSIQSYASRLRKYLSGRWIYHSYLFTIWNRGKCWFWNKIGNNSKK